MKLKRWFQKLAARCPTTDCRWSIERRRGARAVRHVGLVVLPAVIVGSFSCASGTVEVKDIEPRLAEIEGSGAYAWEVERGWLQPTDGDWGDAASLAGEVQKAFDAGRHSDALVGLLELEEMQDDDIPAQTVTHFRIAECYYHLGRYDDAVVYYRKVYREGKPEQSVASQCYQRIYEIAMDFLHGRALCSALGFGYRCPRHGIDLLVGDDGLIIEYGDLVFADEALMEIGKYYFDERQYPEAIPIYERVRDRGSSWASTAQFQLGVSWFRQIRGAEYDEKTISQAEREFRRYLDEPGPYASDARDYLDTIFEMLAKKYLEIAKYYLRESEPRAAEIYLRLVLDRYTSSSAAREAREIQRQLNRLTLRSE